MSSEEKSNQDQERKREREVEKEKRENNWDAYALYLPNYTPYPHHNMDK